MTFPPDLQTPRLAIISAVAFETSRLQSRLQRDLASSDLPLWRGTLEGRPVLLALSGVGKANAARATTLLLERHAPQAVLLIGCGGAYPESGLACGDLAVAEGEIFGDEGAMTSQGFLDLGPLNLPLLENGSDRYFNRLPCSRQLLQTGLPALQRFADQQSLKLRCGDFVTVSSCSGTDELGRWLAARTGGICENMEGAATALCCLTRRTPFFELRGISNLVEERNPSRWNLPGAAAVAQNAALALLAFWSTGGCA